MTVIVTMAGAGRRFSSEGYNVPKYKIKARGKTLFEWSIKSLHKFFGQHFIFACLADHDFQWISEQAKAMGIGSFDVVPRNEISQGQAQTAYDVSHIGDSSEPIWIYNIDTYIEFGIAPSDMLGYQGCVHVFESTNPAMSFVRYDESGEVVEIAEKKVISQWATVGVYGFESSLLYRELYKDAYCAGGVEQVGGEFYVAPIYQLLLRDRKLVCAPKLASDAVHVLGTPEEVKIFDPTIMPPYGS